MAGLGILAQPHMGVLVLRSNELVIYVRVFELVPVPFVVGYVGRTYATKILRYVENQHHHCLHKVMKSSLHANMMQYLICNYEAVRNSEVM